MNTQVVLLPEAREDTLAGRDFFDRCRPGLGEEFEDEVLAALDRISEMPEAYGEVADGVRAKSVKRFGYIVYYRLVQDVVEVVAVLHGSRNPEEWLRRI